MTMKMTINEAITRINALKPNGISQDEKINWLSTLDITIKNEIIDVYEGEEIKDFTGYTSETPLTTPLIVPPPYDEIYLYWLESKINYWNGEMGRYNNSITMFNTAYSAFERHYIKTHKTKGKSFKFF